MITPTSRLDAVNEMLATIGEAPVNALDKAATSDVAFAIKTLDGVSREVQSDGWRFNTESDFELPRDSSGRINLPKNMIRVVLDDYRDIDPVVRGTALYDAKNHTYTFTKNVKATKIVYMLDFEQLPETVRRYVTMRAARLFVQRVRGADATTPYTLQDERDAQRLAKKDHALFSKVNLLKAPTTFDIRLRRARY